MVFMASSKLRYFYEAVMAGSMRAAGDKIGVAVSSISRQISQLEAEYGMPLIEKGRRSIKLTEAGELVLNYYREGLSHRESFDSRLQDLRGMRSGNVCLAAGEGFVSATFSRILGRFLTKNAGITLSVKIASTLEVARMVTEDEAHLGLTFHTAVTPKLRLRTSVPQPVKVIVHPSHPLAGLASVNLRDLTPYAMCLPDQNFRIRQIFEMAEAEEGIHLQSVVTTNSLALMKDMVGLGGFVTLLPEIVAVTELLEKKLVAVPVTNPALERTSINLVSRMGRQLPIAASRLMAVLEAGLKNELRV
jgi:DNA-binding transcriptional LysR family regulator